MALLYANFHSEIQKIRFHSQWVYLIIIIIIIITTTGFIIFIEIETPEDLEKATPSWGRKKLVCKGRKMPIIEFYSNDKCTMALGHGISFPRCIDARVLYTFWFPDRSNCRVISLSDNRKQTLKSASVLRQCHSGVIVFTLRIVYVKIRDTGVSSYSESHLNW